MGMFIHRRKEKAHQEIAKPQLDCTAAVSHIEASEPEKTEVSAAPKSSLTEEDINKLPYFSLKSLASTYGIDVTDKKTKQLRNELIAKLKEE